MSDRQVRYFIAVAEELSFSKAAKRLNVSQPPLSVQIKALEDRIGTPLLLRTKRSVELTPAGAMFLERATKAVEQMDGAVDLVRRAARGEAGLLKVGFTSSVPMLDKFGELLREFRSTYPNVKVELQHMTSGRQLKALVEKELDVGILRPPFGYRGSSELETHDFSHDRLAVFLPEGHRLAKRKGDIAFSDLSEEALVAVSAQGCCGVRDHVEALCSKAGFRPNIVQEANELGTVLGLVAAGIGIAVLSECYKRVAASGVIARQMPHAESRSRLLIAARSRDDNMTSQNFLRLFREQISAHNQ